MLVTHIMKVKGNKSSSSDKVLRQAMAGVYSADKISKMPEQWKKHFFSDIGGGQYRVNGSFSTSSI